MKFENTSVYNIYNAILGARNPMNSWSKSDSETNCRVVETPCSICEFNKGICNNYGMCDNYCHIGKNDMKLMQTLIKAGSEHRKFMRQIFISVDITAPLYWWKEFDTYKVGTVANSTSTMHKLASTPITEDCFENGDILFENTIWLLECCRQDYLKTKDKLEWKKLIVNLPESWLQKRTITMNYENLLSMVHQRKNHKLTEWSKLFIDWVHSLPYADELIFIDK